MPSSAADAFEPDRPDTARHAEREKWEAYYQALPASVTGLPIQQFNAEFAQILAELVPAGGRVLEAGCGGGEQSLALARLGRYEIHLMDFAEEALRHARHVFSEANLHADFLLGDVFEPGAPEYDLVFNAGVLEHYTFDEQVRFLRGMAARSRDWVLVLVPNRLCYWYWLWRMQRQKDGAWPYGKEVPLADLSAVFKAAGLRYLGQLFTAETWTETFLEQAAGLDADLRRQILEIHRSPLITPAIRGYLLAALGSVKPMARKVPARWQRSPWKEHTSEAELHASICDALALRLAAEQQLKELRQALGDRVQDAHHLELQVRRGEQQVALLDAKVRELHGWAEALSNRLVERDQVVGLLNQRLAELQASTESLRSQLAAAQQDGAWLREERARLAAESAELRAALAQRGAETDGLQAALEQHASAGAELRRQVAGREADLAQRAAENTALRGELSELRTRFNELHAWTEKLNAALNDQCRAASALRDRLDEIGRSTGWHLLLTAYRVRFFLFPRGSRRERLARWMMHKQRRLRFYARQGVDPLARAIGHGVRLLFSISQLQPRTRATAHPAAGGDATPPRFAAQVPGLVSVILPVYNQAELLREAIESVLAQTYPHFELIVVNDGSTDGWERVLDDYLGHPKIRLLTQANQKLPKALSNGFDFARGEFWTWTSADNLMAPAQLERQVAFLRAHPDAALVYADYLAIDDRGEPLRHPSFRPHNRRAPDSPEIHVPRSTAALNTTQDNFIGACFLYRGWTGRLLGDYTPSMGVEDYDYWMRMNDLVQLQHLGTDELLYRYRVHDNSLNAQAGAHSIYDRVARLMSYEKDRTWYYQQPWTIYVDAPTQAWLSRVRTGPHAIRALRADESLARSGGKTLILVRGDSLPGLTDRTLPPECCVAAWFDADERAPYCAAAELTDLTDVCYAADDATAARLGLFHPAVFQVALGPPLFDLVVAFANNKIFADKTIPAEDFQRTLPWVYQPPERRIRLLLQVDNFLQGGLEHVVLDLAAALDPHEFEVFLLILGQEGPAAAKARELGWTILRLEGEREAAYRSLLRDRQIDVVNAHYSLFGAAIAAELRIPFLQTIHNTYVWLSADEVAQHRAADACTAGYLCVSNAVAAYADLRLGLPAGKMIAVPNGIDTHALDAARDSLDRTAERAALSLAPSDFVFLCTASLAEVKAQLYLVQALAQALRHNAGIKIALLGRPQDEVYATGYAKTVCAEIERLGVADAVKFLGYHKNPQKFYLIADAFVLPSFVEGWSLALAEALYAGLPVIASDVGAARELLSRTGGHLLPLPFGSLIDNDGERFYHVIRTPHPEYVQEIAQAMLSVAADPRRPVLSESLRQSFRREVAYQAYARVFRWVASGGEFTAARAWVREVHQGPVGTPAGPAERFVPDDYTGDDRPESARRVSHRFRPCEQTLDEVCARVRASRGAVIFPLSIAWSNWLFQRPHHLARYFAQRGYVTIYDDSTRFTGFAGFKEIEPNLYLFRGAGQVLHQIPATILWVFCYNFHLRDGFPADTQAVYDLIDDFSVHPYDPHLMEQNHRRALGEATIVTYVARQLETLLAARPDRIYLPNGVEDEHFADEFVPLPRDPEMQRLLREGKPIAGYYGALAKWFGYPLLERTARLRPDWNFVLIGPNYDASLSNQPLLKLANVRWLGPRDYAVLPAYLRTFDVATIPFALNEITRATSPLKLYEYFAGGKPVVTTAMPECMAFPEVHIVSNPAEFAAALDTARTEGQDPVFRGRLREIARRNSWAKRVSTIVERLQATGARGHNPPDPIESQVVGTRR